MKIRLAEIKSRHQSLCMLGEKKLPIKLSYAVSKNIMKLQEELDAIEKARVQLVEQHAKKDGEGNFIMKDGRYDVGEHEKELNEEFAEFLNTEEEIEIHMVPEKIIDAMEDTRYDVLTPAEIISFDFMLERLQEATIEELESKA